MQFLAFSGYCLLNNLTFLLLPCFLDLLEMKFNQWGHFRRLPVCFFRLLRPGKWQMPDFTRSFGLFENFESFEQDFPLIFSIAHLSHGSTVGILNGCRSRYAYSTSKFVGGRNHNSGKTVCF